MPMEFVGAELTAGFIELAAGELALSLGMPRVDMPSVYEPSGEYWSIKGYAVPGDDADLTCTVVNIKSHTGDDEHGTVVGGTVQWENDNEQNRPESVVIHVYVTDENGERTEVPGSPITVYESDGWVWFIEIPPEYAVEPGGEGSGGQYANIETEEETPEGYETSYECGVVINLVRPIRGDVDCNETVNIADALAAMRHTMSIIAASEQGIINGDMNGDGILNTVDALAIMRMVLLNS